MTIGVCYFPEHWPRDSWETDVEAMAEAGIEYVRMAEFSWARIEPKRGKFDFEWLDAAIELIGDHGMEAVLCTPTATPPLWLVRERPEILQEEADGTVRNAGSRRHYCFNSPAYREETERIVRRMVDRYADSPHVAGWQTDNEYGCHGTIRCYCEDCATAFRKWLGDKFGDVDALDEAWGTTFWSQRHTSFEEVDPPRHTVADQHPSLLLDYYRFASDSVVEYNRLQTELIRQANPEWFVTHNFMGSFPALDAHALSEDLDFASWDSYPLGVVQGGNEPTEDAYRAGDPDTTAFDHDLYRGLTGAPIWVMEQQPGDINWAPDNPQPAEGAMRLWAHHAVAHGTDVVSYFRWRRCREGQEQYHAGLLTADGRLDRGYHDARQAAEELEELDGLENVDAPVAICHDYQNLWALSIQPHGSTFAYWSHLRTYYRALRARGVQVDVVDPESNLDEYAAVVAPTLHLIDDDLAAHLEAYADAGGELLLTIRSGVKDPHNKLLNEPVPGPLSSLTGLTVERHESLPESVETRTTYHEETYEYRTFGEWLEPADAEVLGEHASGVASGRPAIARNEYGDGGVTYCGVWPGSELADAIVGDLLETAEVPHVDPLPDGVRLAERDGHTWVCNFTGNELEIDASGEPTWLVGGATVGPYDVAVAHAPLEAIDVETEGSAGTGSD